MQVAVIGIGLMGAPMAARLIEEGHSVTVFNRSPSKCEPLAELGASVVESVGAAIAASECVITMLADGPSTAAALLRPGTRDVLAGRTIIQMATIGPWESEELESEVAGLGGDYLEAPVLGSTPQAEAGDLVIMVGSSPEQFERWSELLQVFGPDPRHVGPVGQASALKLALNQIIASLTAAFSLSLGIVNREGIPVELFMEILRSSAIYAPTFDKKLELMLSRDFSDPHFPVRLLLKDVDLTLTEAQSLGLEAGALAGLREVVSSALEQGWIEVDYSAIYNAIDPPRKGRD